MQSINNWDNIIWVDVNTFFYFDLVGNIRVLGVNKFYTHKNRNFLNEKKAVEVYERTATKRKRYE